MTARMARRRPVTTAATHLAKVRAHLRFAHLEAIGASIQFTGARHARGDARQRPGDSKGDNIADINGRRGLRLLQG